MKVQCPICRTWHSIPESLVLSTRWKAVRDGRFTDYSLRTVAGRLVAEVWRNIIYDQNHKASLADWHWQYHRLDRCCGALPGGNAGSRAAAMQAAIAGFSVHCAEIQQPGDQPATVAGTQPGRFLAAAEALCGAIGIHTSSDDGGRS